MTNLAAYREAITLEHDIAAPKYGVLPFTKCCPFCGHNAYLTFRVCLPHDRVRRRWWWPFGERCQVPRPHVHGACTRMGGCGARYLIEFPEPHR